MRNSKEMSFQIILRLALAARRTILAEMGYHFTVLTVDIDEKKRSIRMDKPKELVMVLAEVKADAIISRLQTAVIGSVLVTNLKNQKKKRWLA
ncbi:hypothetical protein ACFX11_034816 [Malus domestica]